MKNIKPYVFTLFVLFSPLALIAATLLETDTGFIYPGNMKHQDSSYIGFGQPHPPADDKCHLANDYKLPEGSPVYAVDSGVVEQAGTEIPGYGGDDGSAGGALIIKHNTSSGTVFYALYGHIKNLSVSAGNTVTAGQHIADVGPFNASGNPLPHLHFGINPNIPSYKGYTPTSQCTNYLGYVDPENFLTSNHSKRGSCNAVEDSVSTQKNTIVTTSNVLSNDTDADGDTLSISTADANSANGVAITNNNDGTFTYTPAIDFTGSDSFSYTLTDSNGCTDQGLVSISVTSDDDSSGGSFGFMGITIFSFILFFRRRIHKLFK